MYNEISMLFWSVTDEGLNVSKSIVCFSLLPHFILHSRTHLHAYAHVCAHTHMYMHGVYGFNYGSFLQIVHQEIFR